MHDNPRLLAATVLLLAGGLAAGCSDGSTAELEFADWILPVPEGTPIKEYAPVSVAERDPEAVTLVEDLVIGGDPTDENTMFYQPIGLWASPNGDIFLAEMGNKRVQMFDAEGNFVRTVGKEGQGPGEFQFPFFIIDGTDRFGVYDMRNRRISVFSAEGEHQADQLVTISLFTNLIATRPDGSFVALSIERDEERNQTHVVKLLSLEGEELSRFIEMPGPPRIDEAMMADAKGRAQASLDRSAQPRPLYAATEETVFVSPGNEYQVLAMSPSGEALWALRVAWPRPPYPGRLKRSRIESLREDVPGITEQDLTWPEHYPSISALRTDGNGRLYVFPNVEDMGDEAPEQRPVDVYSPQGELLATGMVDSSWAFARGNHVYGYRGDTSLDQTVIVRWRLVVNGQ